MCVGFIQPVLTSILHAWLRDRNIMSFLAGTPPVNTILTQALPGSPAMKIQVVSLKSGFDFEVKLSYDPTVSWKNGQQKWLQVVFWVFCFDFGGVQELFVCFSASIWSFFWFGLRHLFFSLVCVCDVRCCCFCYLPLVYICVCLKMMYPWQFFVSCSG